VQLKAFGTTPYIDGLRLRQAHAGQLAIELDRRDGTRCPLAGFVRASG